MNVNTDETIVEVSMPRVYRYVGLTHEVDDAAAKVITKKLRERFELQGTLSQENAKGDPHVERYGKICIPWSKKGQMYSGCKGR